MGAAIKEDATAEEIGEILSETIRKLYKEINMPPMSTFVKSKEDMLENIDTLFMGTCFTPRLMTKDDVAFIVTSSYDNN